ncbi:helix-turn-helix transcriptional regulator [Bacteroides uniformis]|uniref:helix-turn-helix transcriptional regulator n=1 Tax=Bacteroides uniformis TaxID=820 RepID=UPI000EDF240D|nr:helix-turn-helix domain-containing protein [Bacteroides uniformis]MDC1997492.1 helix-turn-helix domain-containing protein [Bacteroides uniformis]MDC2001298.1 helix-turn-helix domain-containing protein [Bacteroides uniformis]MDC2004929.1 helix-turn-helix domain-containing protein [Bacteroides uniformis]HCR02598.1 DNA-binding protein [Bacteroides uniformis]
MQGNFIMLQKDDLKQVVSELVEELVGKKSQPDLTSEESDEYYTRDQVCERLHITYTTLWRMQKEGTIIVHKLGGRNLYSKREITSLVRSKVQGSGCSELNV